MDPSERLVSNITLTDHIGSLGQDEVHVWLVRLIATTDRLAKMKAILLPEERARAESFRFVSDHDKYMIRRVALRYLLGQYSKKPLSQVRLITNPYGRPELPRDGADQKLSFSASSSFNLCLIAITSNNEVGIDIERVQFDQNVQEIAQRFFTRREQEWIGDFPPNEQIKAFYRVWTLKEAYTKGKGMGLSIPPDSFEISLDSANQISLQSSRLFPTDIHRWTLSALDVGTEYMAALAIEKKDWSLVQQELPVFWQEDLISR